MQAVVIQHYVFTVRDTSCGALGSRMAMRKECGEMRGGGKGRTRSEQTAQRMVSRGEGKELWSGSEE